MYHEFATFFRYSRTKSTTAMTAEITSAMINVSQTVHTADASFFAISANISACAIIAAKALIYAVLRREIPIIQWVFSIITPVKIKKVRLPIGFTLRKPHILILFYHTAKHLSKEVFNKNSRDKRRYFYYPAEFVQSFMILTGQASAHFPQPVHLS